MSDFVRDLVRVMEGMVGDVVVVDVVRLEFEVEREEWDEYSRDWGSDVVRPIARRKRSLSAMLGTGN